MAEQLKPMRSEVETEPPGDRPDRLLKFRISKLDDPAGIDIHEVVMRAGLVGS